MNKYRLEGILSAVKHNPDWIDGSYTCPMTDGRTITFTNFTNWECDGVSGSGETFYLSAEQAVHQWEKGLKRE